MESRFDFLEPRHDALAREVHDFARAALAPLADREDLDAMRAQIAAMAKAGVFAHAVPEPGGKLDVRALVTVREQLAYFSGAADSMFAVQGLGTYPIFLGGSKAQQERYLPLGRSGEKVFAFALTEPEAGSDAGALKTTARKDGDGYVLDGVKRFISNSGLATYFTVFARTGEGKKGISAFVVEAGTPGFTVRPQLPVMAAHPIAELEFKDCRVPASALLGKEGDGLKLAYGTLDVFRGSVGAAAVGMAQRALDEAVGYAQKREQFGAPLAALQGVQFLLAESAVELEAAKLLVHKAAAVKDAGKERITLEAAMAKLFATEAAQRVIDRCLQIHGGNGVVRGFAVERLYREIRALRIYEGATEVQKLVIASQLLRS